MFQNLETIEANYAIQPSVGIFCRLEPIETLPDGSFKAMVGIRQFRDTKLSLGAKLKLLIPCGEETEVYMTRVIEVSRNEKADIHLLEPPVLQAPSENDWGTKPKVELKVRAFLPEQSSMRNVLLSPEGLKFLYKTTMTSATVGKRIPLFLNDQDHITFECRVKHILYNWWAGTHIVSADFEGLNNPQKELLSRLLGSAACYEESLIRQTPDDTGDPDVSTQRASINPPPETTNILPELSGPDLPEIDDSVLSDTRGTSEDATAEAESVKIIAPKTQKNQMVDASTGRIRFE